MLQAVIKKGGVQIVEVSRPQLGHNYLLIEVLYSCISLGTESASVQNSGKSIFQKAKEKPEKVKKVIDKLISDGPIATLSMVKGELNVSTPSGYSLSGRVIQIGENVSNFEIGDIVAAAGSSANHAQIVSVPFKLVTKISNPKYVQEASTVAIGSIALHGVRRAGNKLGETCVVMGTGIIGLLTVQLLVSSGVRVCAIDLDNKKLALAKKFGAEITLNPEEGFINTILNWSGGTGVDSVIIAASSNSNEILSNSFNICRRKGKVVLVGSVGMNIKREDIYSKEIDFQISTSYGPGRYDDQYEIEGNDYPLAYVRWTEGRNMEEYLRLLINGTLSLKDMISATYDIKDASNAFARSDSDKLSLFSFISYSENEVKDSISFDNPIIAGNKKRIINIGLIGAGAFAKNIMLPNISKLSNYYQLKSVFSRTGVKAKDLLESFNGSVLVEEEDQIFKDPEIDLVIITSNHGSHGNYVIKALENNKHVFVEKPLAADKASLDQIKLLLGGSNHFSSTLTVGFNRRFSRYAQAIKSQLKNRINPLIMYYRMNAGYLPDEHWVHKDGGRIIGECCHIIDLASFFTESKIKSIAYDYLTPTTAHIKTSDNRAITLKYQDGSIAHIQYFSVGSKALSKEYFEINFDQTSFIVDDYKSLHSFGSASKDFNTKKSEKGHFEIMEALGKSLTSESPYNIITTDSLIETTEATFEIAQD